MKRIRIFLAAFALLLGVGGMVPAVASADSPSQTVCSSLTNSTDCSTPPPGGSLSLNKVLGAVIRILSILIGVTAVIMIMVSGFKYITAGGDSSKVTSAKSTLLYAIVGLVVAALAEGLVQFVLVKLK